MATPPGIEIVDDAFSNGAEIIAAVEALDAWKRSEIGSDRQQSDIRTSTTAFLPFVSYRNPAVIHDFGRTVWQVVDNYAALYGVPYDHVEPMAFNRYEPGQRFNAHPDYFKGSNRVFSAVAYLNTIAEGGGTRFVHYDLTVEAVAGRIVVFPSNYLFMHEGVAPTETTKYSAAFWMQG